jgi:hypothetical protein
MSADQETSYRWKPILKKDGTTILENHSDNP